MVLTGFLDRPGVGRCRRGRGRRWSISIGVVAGQPVRVGGSGRDQHQVGE
jgi:hypothetical protein